MSSLLRYPGVVPSLFSDGIDCDISPMTGASLPRRAVALLANGLALRWLNRSNKMLRPASLFLANMTAVVCSKPLLLALLAGGAGPN